MNRQELIERNEELQKEIEANKQKIKDIDIQSVFSKYGISLDTIIECDGIKGIVSDFCFYSYGELFYVELNLFKKDGTIGKTSKKIYRESLEKGFTIL